MNAQDQERLERWDSVVANWLADCDSIEPEAVSVRPVVHPRGLIISEKPERRQALQLSLTQSGYQMQTARDLEAGLQKAEQQFWDLVILEQGLFQLLSERELAKLSSCCEQLQVDVAR